MAWVGSHGDVSRHVVCGSILESWRNIPCGTSSEASAAYLEGEIVCVCVRFEFGDPAFSCANTNEMGVEDSDRRKIVKIHQNLFSTVSQRKGLAAQFIG